MIVQAQRDVLNGFRRQIAMPGEATDFRLHMPHQTPLFSDLSLF